MAFRGYKTSDALVNVARSEGSAVPEKRVLLRITVLGDLGSRKVETLRPVVVKMTRRCPWLAC
jgi:hypothetical protein